MHQTNNNILVLGYFGYRTDQRDGQTVKTRDLYLLLEKQKIGSIDYFDTQEFQFEKFSILTMINKLKSCNTLVYLPAHNNLKYIFPIIFLLSVFYRFDILYFIVGGWLNEYLKNKPMLRYMLKRIKRVFSETLLLKQELELTYKFKNVTRFPNFRFIDFVPEKRISQNGLKLVFFARINQMKGLDVIFLLAEYINKKYSDIIIDFYGYINEPDKDYFKSHVEKYSFIEYKGILEFEEIHRTLEKYDALLLPTHFFTEGLPGSIIDAYIAGIPVIVTKWKYATEFVEDQKTGYIIPFEDGLEDLYNEVDLLYNNNKMLDEMKANAFNKRTEFSSDSAWSILKPYFL